MHNMKRKFIVLLLVACLGVAIQSGLSVPVMAAEPLLTDYTAYPLMLSSRVKPNVMVVLDSSTSMLRFAYSGAYDPATVYDGFFDHAALYSYDTTNNYFFTPKQTTDNSIGVNYWEGNFLNWACMRRIDIAKSVLTGGECITVGGSYVIKANTWSDNCGGSGEFQLGTSGDGDRRYDYNNDGPVETYRHYRDASTIGPNFRIDSSGTYYYIRIKVATSPTGIIQDMGSMVRFGLATYSPVWESTYGVTQGGRVWSPIGSAVATIVNQVNSQREESIPGGHDTWTPMGEVLYTMTGYFRQTGGNNLEWGPKYHDHDYETGNYGGVNWDPYYSSVGTADCLKSYVILISDGEANNDSKVPTSPTNYVPAMDLSGTTLLTVYGDITGSDKILDNIAYWAHTHDLRSTITGTQNLTLYTISAFGGGAALLQSAAKLGGFKDSNGNNVPDLTSEWDNDGNSIPDNYYAASTASALKSALSQSLISILSDTAAGTAISMITTSGDGTGSIIQAYFQSYRAATHVGEKDTKWIGYLHSFWIDGHANLREDSIQDAMLDLTEDRIITFVTDTDNSVKLYRQNVDDDHPYGTGSGTTIEVSDAKPIWDAGQRLADGDPDDRKIFTYLDKDKNGQVDESSYDPFDILSELVRFNTDNASAVKPYLGVADNSAWSYLGATEDDRVGNLIRWIRGQETGMSGSPDLRSRLINTKVWKLGDIVDSSPITIGNPQQRFDALYGDMDYNAFCQYVINTLQRESVVYVGGNDGMLHAFTAGRFNSNTYEFEKGNSGKNLGEELWAYIPQTLLPHLKWLPSKDYTHTYYVDLTPVVSDAQIYNPSNPDTHGWATVLLGGLNMGGKHIQATGDFGTGTETRDFDPTYFCMDITDPLHPKVLWEKSYANLGMTTSKPFIFKVNNKWYAAFGSGPTTYDATSIQQARIFVVDLLTGVPYHNAGGDPWLYSGTTPASGYMNSPIVYDHELDFSADGVYFGESYQSGTSNWNGRAWKLLIPTKDENPLDWKWDYFFSSPIDVPISAPLTLARCKDNINKIWNLVTYFGTGRYYSDDDKTNTDQQFLFKVKDPYYNWYGGYYFDATGALSHLTLSDLLSDNCRYGWYFELPEVGERSFIKTIVFANIAIYSSFEPNQDPCGYGGDGYLWLTCACCCSGTTKIEGGDPSGQPPKIYPKFNDKIDVLGQQPKITGGKITLIIQDNRGRITNKEVEVTNIPRNRFIKWRDN